MASAQPGCPVLNLDILLDVMHFCDRPTKSRLSRTCKVLHEHAPWFLLEGTVKIGDRAQLKSFHRILSVDGFSRTSFLRDLQLEGENDPDLPASFGGHLVSILQHSAHLEALSISHVECVAVSCPGTSFLCDALSHLATLRHLRIRDAGLLARDLVATLQLPLVSMDLEYQEDDPDPPSDPELQSMGDIWEELLRDHEIPDWHPALVCEQMAPTLEKLAARFINPRSPYVPWADLGLRTYANLHTLVLYDDWPFARPWIISCPHLRYLTVRSLRWDPQDRDLYVLSDWEPHRQLNLDDQRAHGSWTALEEYSGDNVVALYLCGLTCRIPRLVLSEDLDEDGLVMFREILCEAKPADLVFQVAEVANTLGDPDGEGGIATLLCQNGAGSYIENLDFRLSMGTEDISQMTRNLIRALARLPRLEKLKLKLSAESKGPRSIRHPKAPRIHHLSHLRRGRDQRTDRTHIQEALPAAA
ncbi:hypothetical protein BV20DRAFT_961482 [Pilatotrama ljubarskyi]|nr:hypothetical protein BV20DRAFT_961482 [Pilatotrama ljubarskyi]